MTPQELQTESYIPQDPSIPKWNMPVSMQDNMRPEVWTGERIKKAEQSLLSSLGTSSLMPPGPVELQNRLNTWWSTEGQHLPRHVLDRIGIVGGDKVPTVAELDKIDRRRQVDIVNDFLGLKPDPQSGDPLAQITIADPSDVSLETTEASPELSERIKVVDTEDLTKIHKVLEGNLLDFDEKIYRAVDDELRIREAIDEVIIPEMQERPLTTLIGTDFFNKLGRGLPEYTSRKGFNPIEALVNDSGNKWNASILFRAAGRVREQLAQQDPRLLTKIGLSSGELGADLIHFALLPDVGKAKAFDQLSKTVKMAIGIGTKAGLLAALQAPEQDETFDDRAKEIAMATGTGALTGVILSKAITYIQDIPVNIRAAKLAERFPQIKQNEWVEILKVAKEGRLLSLQVEPVIEPARRMVPTGFRMGMADIEKPAKALGKVVGAAGQKKATEVAAVLAAKALPKIAYPVKPINPTKILTKVEALSFQESNMVTGDDVNIRIVADAKMQRSIQSEEKKIAILKTKLAQLRADKKVELGRSTEIEIAKKETAIAALKEKHGVKLETTIEGAKARIAKMRAATQFKDELRKDAVSLVQTIPKEGRASFLLRASNVKTTKGLQKLAAEVDVQIDKIERKVAVGDLRDTIKNIESKNRLGQVRLGKVPSPQREKLIAIIDEISTKKISTQLTPAATEGEEDFVKTFGQLDVKARRGREQLLGADLQSLQKVTQRLSSELAGGLEALDADVEAALRLPNERVRQLNLLTQRNVDEIDVDDIRLVTDSLQLLVGQAKLKGQLLTKQGLKPLDKAVPKAIAELSPTKRATKAAGKEITPTERTAVQKTTDFIARAAKLESAHLDTLSELSTNPKTRDIITQIVDTDLHSGMKATAEKQLDWVNKTTEKFKSIGLTDLKQLEKEFIVTLAGKKVKVTVDELLSLEMHSRSADNLRSFLNTRGIEVGGKVLEYPIDVDRLGEFNEALANIRSDPVIMGFADWIGELSIQQAEAINETFLLERGYEVARGDNYFPRSRVLPKRIEGGKSDISVPPEEQGRYQPRTGGTSPLRLTKASQEFLSGIESDAFMYGMTIPLRNARLLLGNAKFQQAMKDAGREQELNAAITILRRTQGMMTSHSTVEQFSSWMLRKFIPTALGFRVSTIGTQVMSYPAAFAEISPKYWRPITPLVGKTIERLKRNSAILSLRWQSRRIGVEVGTSASADAFSILFFGKSQSLANISMKGLPYGDQRAIANFTQNGIDDELLYESRNGKNVDPYTWDGRNVADLPKITDIESKIGQYCEARRAEYVTRRTQPMFDMLDRSVSLSNPNVIERSLFIFRTALEAQENIAMRATDTYSKSAKTLTDKKALTEDFGSVVAAAFSVAVWKNGLRWAIGKGAIAALAAVGIFKYKDPDKDSVSRQLGEDTLKNVISLNKFGRIAIKIGEFVADELTGEGYNWNRNSFQNPIPEILEAGKETIGSIAVAIQDTGLMDEFITEVTSKADEEFNEQLAKRISDDVLKAIRSSFDFGARISGTPILAPMQEFLSPLLQDSKIPIIREVTFGDVESPKDFSDRVFTLYEKRKELMKKSKTKRLSTDEERALSRLDDFTEAASKTTEIVREISDPDQRRLRFSLFDIKLRMTEERLKGETAWRRRD